MKEGWGDWREGERWEMAILIKWKCIFCPCYWFGPVVLYVCPIESCSEVVEANQEHQQQQQQPQLAAISDAGALNHSHLHSSTVQLLVFMLHFSSSVSSLFLSALRLTVLQSATCCRQRCRTSFFQFFHFSITGSDISFTFHNSATCVSVSKNRFF